MRYSNQVGTNCGQSGNEQCVTCDENLVLDSYQNTCVPKSYAARGGYDDAGPLVTCNDGTKDVSNGIVLPCIAHGGVMSNADAAPDPNKPKPPKPDNKSSLDKINWVLFGGIFLTSLWIGYNYRK